jgi:hypothetical protein
MGVGQQPPSVILDLWGIASTEVFFMLIKVGFRSTINNVSA